MSSTLNVYAVPLERLQHSAGSHDQTLIAATVAGQKSLLHNADLLDDDGIGFPCAEAVADLINGRITQNEQGYLYGYAFQAICAQLGKTLPHFGPISGVPAWTETVDAQLKAQAIPITVDKLVYGGSPIRIPEPDDYPFIGHWKPETIAPALAAFQAVKADAWAGEMKETMATIRGWLEATAKTPGAALIGFVF